tara:strand:+ start:182 stop:331 length:150 start_codon:yes stop_codon:yes gene_type:complete
MKENVDLVKISELRHPMSLKPQPILKNPVKTIDAKKALNTVVTGVIKGE